MRSMMIGLTAALVLSGRPMALAADTPTTGAIGDNGTLNRRISRS